MERPRRAVLENTTINRSTRAVLCSFPPHHSSQPTPTASRVARVRILTPDILPSTKNLKPTTSSYITMAKKSKARAMPAPTLAPCLTHSLQNEDWSAETKKVKAEQILAFSHEYDKVTNRPPLRTPGNKCFPSRSQTFGNRGEGERNRWWQLLPTYKLLLASRTNGFSIQQHSQDALWWQQRTTGRPLEDSVESIGNKTHSSRSDSQTDSAFRLVFPESNL